MRILLVEDDAGLRRYVRAALEEGGFSGDEAACLADATALVESVPYDAVVLDLSLPDGDGLSLIDTIRRARAALPVLVLTARDEAGKPRVDLPEWLAALYRSGAFLYAVNDAAGSPIASSTPEVGGLVARLPAPGDKPAYFRLRSFGAGKKDYFGLTARVESRAGQLRVTIARAADDDVLVSALLREFVLNLAWLVPLMIGATLAIGVLAARRGLRPLRDVSASAAAIDPGRMSARLAQENVASEVRPLVAAVNDALDRLEKGFAVQRQFTADAAHQLRTPLSILTAGLERLGNHGEVDKLRKDVARMNRLVEQLLRVARLDAVAWLAGGSSSPGAVRSRQRAHARGARHGTAHPRAG